MRVLTLRENGSLIDNNDVVAILCTEKESLLIQNAMETAIPKPCLESETSVSCPTCGVVLKTNDDGLLEGRYCNDCGQRVYITTEEIGKGEYATVFCQKAGIEYVISKTCKLRCDKYEDCLKKSEKRKVFDTKKY